MLVMPILNTSKDGINRIYNVEIRLKTATKVKVNTTLKGFDEADVIVNGSSFKKSIFDIRNNEEQVVVNFIRNKNCHSDRKDFLITTRKNSNSVLYDLYNVVIPPRKVTIGLDRLYGKVIVDMQKEIPNIKRGRYISLKQTGVDSHITTEKINNLRYIVDNLTDKNNLDYMILANNLGDLKTTLDFIKLFDFTIISEATVNERQITDLLEILSHTYGKDSRNLENYYKIAKENKEVYKKLSTLNQILYGKPINLIQSREKSKVLTKISERKYERVNDDSNKQSV